MGAVQAKEQQQVPIDGQPVSLDGIQAKVVAVNVEGLNRTQNDIVMANVKDLFNVRICMYLLVDRRTPLLLTVMSMVSLLISPTKNMHEQTIPTLFSKKKCCMLPT